MTRYIAIRILQGLVVLWGISVVVVVLLRLIPGNPGRLVLGIRASAAAVARLDRELGLEKSIPVQYVDYVGDLFRGNLGTSITEHIPVLSVIAPHIVPSVLLLTYAMVISLAIAMPLGLIAALRRNRAADHAIRLFSVVGYAMAPFWFGLLLALFFGLRWHVFPTSGFDDGSLVGIVRTLTLPSLTVSLYTAPALVRTLRASLIDSLNADYVEAAKARGLSAHRVLVRHVVRNSLTATVTLAGVTVGTMLSLAVVVEQVFAIPGLGSLLVSSVESRDYPTVQGLALIFSRGLSSLRTFWLTCCMR